MSGIDIRIVGRGKNGVNAMSLDNLFHYFDKNNRMRLSIVMLLIVTDLYKHTYDYSFKHNANHNIMISIIDGLFIY